MIAELLGLIDTLSKIKDLKDLLAQERLNMMIKFLETVGEVQIKTAIEELRAVQHSTRPDDERSRSIGQLKVAANALIASLERRPLFKGLMGFDKKRKMRTYLQITGCYLVVTSLYLTQRNMRLAGQYAAKAMEAFDGYAEIRQVELRKALFAEFTYNGGTDQAPLVCVANSKKLGVLMERYDVHGMPDETTLHELAAKMVKGERERLFGWLGPLGIRS